MGSSNNYGNYVPGRKLEIVNPEDADKETILKYSNIIHKIIWKNHVPPSDHEDVFQSIVLYTLKQLPRFDKTRAHFSTFLYYQSIAAIKEYWRSFSRNEKVCVEPRIPDTMQDNSELADDPIDQIRDFTSLTGRDIEESIELREILQKVVNIGKDHYGIENPFNASRKDRIKLQHIYMEISGKVPPTNLTKKSLKKVTTKLPAVNSQLTLDFES